MFDDYRDDEFDFEDELRDSCDEVIASLQAYFESTLDVSSDVLNVECYDYEDTGDKSSLLMHIAVYLKDSSLFDPVVESVKGFKFSSSGEKEWGKQLSPDDFEENTTEFEVNLESLEINEDECHREADDSFDCLVDLSAIVSIEEGSTSYDSRFDW